MVELSITEIGSPKTIGVGTMQARYEVALRRTEKKLAQAPSSGVP